MPNNTKKLTLTMQIVLAMLLGGLLGLAVNLWFSEVAWVQNFIVNGIFAVIGSIFVNALKMMVVPLVLVSLITGVTSLGDVRALGRIGGKALLLYLITTAIAITLALFLAVTIDPGSGFEMAKEKLVFEAKPPPDLAAVLVAMVPQNPVQAMNEGSMLQIIVFALLFGIAITLSGEKGQHVFNFFTDLDSVIMKMVEIIMKLAPFGVFCLIAKTFAGQGLELLAPLAKYFLVVTATLFLHAVATFSVLLAVIGKLNPWLFFKKIRAMLVFAFSTASSNATIPVTLRTTETRLGVDNTVASFTVPLGATINMDGTAIMQGVATVFIAGVYGIDLGMSDYLIVILTATLASIGTAGVPGVGLIMLAMVLGEVGLPVEGIALIIGVDRLLDMMRTAVNVTGDATITCLIAKSENALDETVYHEPEAGNIKND
ncbi:dicarboxylate/amino acid:cation symporter [Candidatus Venteria ishoeyi]|uniref:Proton glutamate symport protein n=1 Tax=Candidatus Venteria ishoeyi TaxID=1899563 RepID=A0A1H6F2Q6_9GAMM|nr:dicarboxylate/amino acid:cation symporter [Candidatus Venteria ishoeyi]SEH04448.1 Proton glutamate symport protein [Candidatus Venteria ishoeyi]